MGLGLDLGAISVRGSTTTTFRAFFLAIKPYFYISFFYLGILEEFFGFLVYSGYFFRGLE